MQLNISVHSSDGSDKRKKFYMTETCLDKMVLLLIYFFYPLSFQVFWTLSSKLRIKVLLRTVIFAKAKAARILKSFLDKDKNFI